jgi:hypothetical protein
MKLLFLLLFIITNASAMELAVCNGEFALCAASGATATGAKITVNGKTFEKGVAVCPVLTGKSVADLSLMSGSCKAPFGKVWSLFSTATSFPQGPSWNTVTAVPRTFVTGAKPTEKMSNMWSFLCDKRPGKVNGVQLADCYGPLSESPWTATEVPTGTRVVTDAPEGSTYSVGGNLPKEK